MLVIGINNRKKKTTKGFTLVELIIVIAIIWILYVITVPAYGKYIKDAKEKVCNANCVQVERMYKCHLELENIKHSENAFSQFMHEYGKIICPCHGEIAYVDGKVVCSVHVKEDSGGDEDVPFLD
ncbi:prepilin-type N-terminal cleavage/methylation domain-containing protein [Haloimpatiens sp. FM7315]|uniref:prepilin-type N-terminal cleavage/methylation domain-containing protein n=1 Tax=Haloimpatiens sp. FM7315 TaxID=3298609 RepID=UPI00370B6F18